MVCFVNDVTEIRFPSREVADMFSHSAECKEDYFGVSVLRQGRASFFCLYYLTAHTEKNV